MLTKFTRSLIYLAVVLVFLYRANAETAACPTKPGLYAKVARDWKEIPRESNPVTAYKPNYFSPTMPRVNKEFAGEKAFVTLQTPLELCVVGTTTNSSFSMEKATVKNGTRTIVQTGNFHDGKGSQSQAMASVTDEQGNIRLMTNGIRPGQYIVVMLGGFKAPPRPPSGNVQADVASAAMESSAAIVASFQSGSQGMNFGIGIE